MTGIPGWRTFRLTSLSILVLLAAAVAGCSVPKSDAPNGVISFDLDPHSGAIRSVALGLASHYTEPRPPQFYMKMTDGTTTVWKAKAVLRMGPATTVTIQSIRGPVTVRPHSTVVFYFYEAGKEDPVVLPPVPVPQPASILNSNFAYWTQTARPVPAYWQVTAAARTSYDIQLLNMYGGVRVSVAVTPVQTPGAIATPIPGSVPAVALSQDVGEFGRRLHMKMRPFEPCTISGNRVTAATGLMISDASRAEALFCIGRSAYSGKAFIGGRRIAVTIVPGKIAAWNDVAFDIGKATRELGPPPLTFALVAEVDALRSPYDWITMDVESLSSVP